MGVSPPGHRPAAAGDGDDAAACSRMSLAGGAALAVAHHFARKGACLLAFGLQPGGLDTSHFLTCGLLPLQLQLAGS